MLWIYVAETSLVPIILSRAVTHTENASPPHTHFPLLRPLLIGVKIVQQYTLSVRRDPIYHTLEDGSQ